MYHGQQKEATKCMNQVNTTNTKHAMKVELLKFVSLLAIISFTEISYYVL